MKCFNKLTICALMLAGIALSADILAQGGAMLGQRHVTNRTSSDTIQVGRARGAFSGIRMEVDGAALVFRRVVIHFDNGEVHVVDDQQRRKKDRLRPGTIEFDRGSRFIDRVVVHYEPRSTGWKGASLRVYGVR